MSSLAARSLAGDRRSDYLGPDAAQFAALRAFRAAGQRRRRSDLALPRRCTTSYPATVGRIGEAAANRLTGFGDGVLAAIDDTMSKVAVAERELSRLFEADIVSISTSRPSAPVRLADGMERLEAVLAGDTDAERRVLAMLAYGRAERGAGADEAAQLAGRALEGGHLLHDGARSPALLAAGLVLGLAGRTEAAEELFGELLGRAQATQCFATFAAACGQRGVERYRRGALAEAAEDLQGALDAARGQPWETMVDDGRAHLLRVHMERGHIDAAEQELEAWCATGPLPETTFGTRILIERGRLRLAQGRFADAVTDLESAGRRLTQRADSMMFEWRSPAALAHHHVGERRTALELADANLELARTWGAPRQLGIAAATMGKIEGGTEGIGRLREAVQILERSPARLEHARALIGLGGLLRRAGEPTQARTQLRAGLELATSIGAVALSARAQQEIAATGPSRRCRTLMSGPDALTPSERRVAHMAASGLSNPDIARTLFVTRKTVEMHLGNVYRKLQINSRRQLGSVLGHGHLTAVGD
jgi:DNA-binding CsgD family transcriptional regulator